MSIYATALLFTSDPEGDSAPLSYRGSHVLPADGDDRDGELFLCEIPGFIDRLPDLPALDEYGERVWPWLRLSATTDQDVTVVLDRAQVEKIHDYLGGWLQRAGPGGG